MRNVWGDPEHRKLLLRRPRRVINVGPTPDRRALTAAYDMGGNVNQWNEQIVGSSCGLRGGSWANLASSLAASTPNLDTPTDASSSSGFRIVTLAPDTDGDGFQIRSTTAR